MKKKSALRAASCGLALDHVQRQGAAPEITNYFAARQAYGEDEAAWNAGGWVKNPIFDPSGADSFELGVGGTRGHGITSSWGADPMDDYTDNLVFPSGTADPLFLSDWEWMFQTFEEAVWPALGLTSNKDGGDAYMMSVYFRGSSGQGDFSSSFGRGNALIYLDQETGKLKNGATSESTRLYAEYMNGWYNKGWLDNKFTNSSRQADLFYQIDTPNMLAGKIGAFIGKRAIQLGNLMEDSTLPLTQGIMVFGAAIPMNDVIGDGAYRFVEPDTIYQESRIAGRSMVTTSAEGKNLAALFSFLDYLYSPEGAELVSLGLSKEQYEETQDEFYTKWGLTEGAYVKYDSPDADGNLYGWAESNPETATLNSAARINRFDLGLHYVGIVDHNLQAVDQYSVDNWNRYPNVGNILANLVTKVEGDRDYNLAYAGWMDNIGSLASVIKSANDTEFNVNWEYYTGLVQKDMDTVMGYM